MSLQEIILAPHIPFIQQKNNKNSSVQHQMDQIALYGYFCAFQLKVKEEGKKKNCLKKYLYVHDEFLN